MAAEYVDAAILGPAIKREITYRVLCGPRAETLFAMLGRSGHAAQIHAVLRRMHARYAERLNVADSWEFKRLFGNSPLEESKRVREMFGLSSAENEPANAIDLGNLY